MNTHQELSFDASCDMASYDYGSNAIASACSSTQADQRSNQHKKGRRQGLIMQIRAQTWASDSHGLYDYESCNIVVQGFKCACMHEIYHIVRQGTDIKFFPLYEATKYYEGTPTAETLAEIRWLNGAYYVCPPSNKEKGKNNHLWLAVRQLRDRTAAITTGDVLRLGRFKLKVKETVITAKDISRSSDFFGNETDYEDDCETAAPPPESNPHEAFEIIDQDQFSRCLDLTSRGARRPTVAFDESFEKSERNLLVPGDEENQVPDADHCVETSVQTSASHDASTSAPPICRVCLCENNELPADQFLKDKRSRHENSTSFNPFVAPCSCKGSMKWIHLQCLRKWMAGRLNIHTDSVSYFWRPLECELCKTLYPTFVDISGNQYSRIMRRGTEKNSDNFQLPPHEGENREVVHAASCTDLAQCSPRTTLSSASLRRAGTQMIKLFQLPSPKIPYAILAIMDSQAQNNGGYYIVGLANHCVAHIGRGHDAHIRVSDISVSRLHAIIRYQPPVAIKRMSSSFSLMSSAGYGIPYDSAFANGSFFIEDHRSKFGTLLELRKPFRLTHNFPAASFQVNRTVITIMLKKRWRFRIPACMRYNLSDVYVILRQPAAATVQRPSNLPPALFPNYSDDDVNTSTHRAQNLNER